MSSKSLKGLTRGPVNFKTVFASMRAAATTEDDRSAAIAAGALVELALEKAIKHRFRRLTKTEQNALFDGTAPLATFSAKIRLGYAIGIFGKKERHDLETINAIRNVFAHSIPEVTFKNRRIRNKIQGMYAIKKHFGDKKLDSSEARSEYLGITRNFWLQLVLLPGPRLPTPPPFPAFGTPRHVKRQADSTAE